MHRALPILGDRVNDGAVLHSRPRRRRPSWHGIDGRHLSGHCRIVIVRKQISSWPTDRFRSLLAGRKGGESVLRHAGNDGVTIVSIAAAAALAGENTLLDAGLGGAIARAAPARVLGSHRCSVD